MTLRAIPSTDGSDTAWRANGDFITHAASVLRSVQQWQTDLEGNYGVRTISAPSARSMTSFSILIFAGRVIMHLDGSFSCRSRTA